MDPSAPPKQPEQPAPDPQPLAGRLAAELERWSHTLGLSEDEVVGRLGRAHLAPLAFLILSRQNGLRSLVDKLKPYYLKAVGLAMVQSQLFEHLELAAAGLSDPPVLLKGAALAPTVYPEVAARPMGDIDIWLPAVEIPPLVKQLEKMGFRFVRSQAADHQLKAIRSGEYQLVFPQWQNLLIELHATPYPGWWLDQTTTTGAAVDEIWQRCGPLAARPGFRQMDAADIVIHLATHLAINHQFGLHPLRSLVDLVLAIENRPPAWADLIERATRWRLRPVLWRSLTAAKEIWKVDIPPAVIEALAPGSGQKRLLRRLVSPADLLAERDRSKSVGRYLILLALVERPADRRRLIKTALWPSGDDFPGGGSRLRRLWQVIRSGEL